MAGVKGFDFSQVKDRVRRSAPPWDVRKRIYNEQQRLKNLNAMSSRAQGLSVANLTAPRPRPPRPQSVSPSSAKKLPNQSGVLKKGATTNNPFAPSRDELTERRRAQQQYKPPTPKLSPELQKKSMCAQDDPNSVVRRPYSATAIRRIQARQAYSTSPAMRKLRPQSASPTRKDVPFGSNSPFATAAASSKYSGTASHSKSGHRSDRPQSASTCRTDTSFMDHLGADPTGGAVKTPNWLNTPAVGMGKAKFTIPDHVEDTEKLTFASNLIPRVASPPQKKVSKTHAQLISQGGLFEDDEPIHAMPHPSFFSPMSKSLTVNDIIENESLLREKRRTKTEPLPPTLDPEWEKLMRLVYEDLDDDEEGSDDDRRMVTKANGNPWDSDNDMTNFKAEWQNHHWDISWVVGQEEKRQVQIDKRMAEIAKREEEKQRLYEGLTKTKKVKRTILTPFEQTIRNLRIQMFRHHLSLSNVTIFKEGAAGVNGNLKHEEDSCGDESELGLSQSSQT